MFDKKKYQYVFVRFMDMQPEYSYRYDGDDIRVDDIVIVPTQKGESYGTVTKIKRYSERKVPFPLEMTKHIIRIAGHRIGVNITEADRQSMMWVGNDNPLPHIDWAGRPAYWITHKKGLKKPAFECGYCRVLFDTAFPVCPNCHKQMNGKMTEEERKFQEKRYKAVPAASWTEEEHLWGDKTYVCSNCGSRFKSKSEYCINCHCHMTRTKSDPVWVDEMAFYDGDF